MKDWLITIIGLLLILCLIVITPYTMIININNIMDTHITMTWTKWFSCWLLVIMVGDVPFKFNKK